MEDRIDRKLLYTTTKIINHTLNGETKHSTGFLYNFTLHDGKIVRVVLTCKHCIKDYAKIELLFCADDGKANPIDLESYVLNFNIDSQEFIVYHKNKDCDVAALIFSYDTRLFISGNKQPFFLSLDKSLIPNPTQIDDLSYIEDVIMIGYPQGIWDDYNNKPIIRRGLTATPLQLNFKGKPEFLVDLASFHGSSGSPVFIYNQTSYTTKNSIILGNRIYLLGIFYGGWEEVTGQTTTSKMSLCGTNETQIAKILLPNNLGFVLKSAVFEDMLPQIEEKIENLIKHSNKD